MQDRFDLARISNNGINTIKKAKSFCSNSPNLLKFCENYMNGQILQEIYDTLLVLASGCGPFDVDFTSGNDASSLQVLSQKDRKKLLNSLPPTIKKIFANEVSGEDFEEKFENLLEIATNETLSISRIKCDKRKDKEFINNFLMLQKNNFQTLASHEKLYLLTVLIFNLVTKTLIWTSGKAVPDLISFISTFVMAETKYDDIMDLLLEVKDKIIGKLKDGTINEFDKDLDDSLRKLYSLVENFNQKKSASASELASDPATSEKTPTRSTTRPKKSGASPKTSASPSTHAMTTRSEAKNNQNNESSDVEVVAKVGKLEDFEEKESSSEEEIVIEKPKGRRRNRRAD